MNEPLFWAVIVLIFVFALTNGFLDGGGIVSTVIATRALQPLPALIVVAVGEIAGLFFLGHAVARTVGVRLLQIPSSSLSPDLLAVLLCAVLGALGWNTLMWRWSLPSSSSHALIGGLLGAFAVGVGLEAIRWPVAIRVLILLGVGPWLAAGTAYLFSWLLRWFGAWLMPSAGRWVRAAHIVVLGGFAMAHGSMDGQKSLALMWLAISTLGIGTSMLERRLWPGLCASALAIGVILGSQRTLRTVGQRLYRVQSLQGLCAEASAMMLVISSSLAGWPMASSHVMSSAVLGAGSAVRPKAIRWGIVSEIAVAWIFTIPASALVAGTLVWAGRSVFHVVP